MKHSFDFTRLGALSRIDEMGGYHSPNIAYVDTPATLYSDIMTKLQANAGGAVQSLPDGNLFGSRLRRQISKIVLATQLSGSFIWVARIPLGACLLDINAMTDTSLGTATIAFGDAHNGNTAIYGVAATLTALNTKTRFGPPLAQWNVPITTGYDYLAKLVTAYAPSSIGGAGFEDIIMTTAVANLPASGNLYLEFVYAID